MIVLQQKYEEMFDVNCFTYILKVLFFSISLVYTTVSKLTKNVESCLIGLRIALFFVMFSF